MACGILLAGGAVFSGWAGAIDIMIKIRVGDGDLTGPGRYRRAWWIHDEYSSASTSISFFVFVIH